MTKTAMYVTFFYALDRSSWGPDWQRSPSQYMDKFKDLLQILQDSGQQIVVYASDETVLDIAKQHKSAIPIRRELAEFAAWHLRPRIKTAMARKYKRYNVPEYFSEEAVCLWLCKFQALADASAIAPEDEIRWIDAGIREVKQYKWNRPWTKPGIHVVCTGPDSTPEWLYTEFPCQSVAAGCFGAKTREDALWLRERADALQQELLARGNYGNDQVVLSILLKRHKSRFVVTRAFKQYIPFQILGHAKWGEILKVLHEEDAYEDYRVPFALLVVCLLYTVYTLMRKIK